MKRLRYFRVRVPKWFCRLFHYKAWTGGRTSDGTTWKKWVNANWCPMCQRYAWKEKAAR